jgi:4-amino-4-deoxy-L-arabinose transferase-like glycosyltransferase
MQADSNIDASADFRGRFLRWHLALIGVLWAAVFFAGLFAPPLLDDADATHAQAARAMLTSGDYVTLHVNGIRYLEKAPLPYWITAVSFRIFGFNTFAVHLPQALAMLALALLGYRWAQRAGGYDAALYTAVAMLTCAGGFLFTRILIPEALLSLFLALALYALLRLLNSSAEKPFFAYLLWASLALAVLTKGLVGLVFFFAAAAVFLLLTREYRQWRRLRPLSGFALFLLIAAPWHVLAAVRNPGGSAGGAGGHGFLWFYFVNEHVLRFLGKRVPRDYNKLPPLAFWLLHFVWLFPWSLFAAPLAVQLRRYWHTPPRMENLRGWRGFLWLWLALTVAETLRGMLHLDFVSYLIAVAAIAVLLDCWRKARVLGGIGPVATFATHSRFLLMIFAATVLLFFSLSTNQEYYTFPVYLPLIVCGAVSLTSAERYFPIDRILRRGLLLGHWLLLVVGVSSAAALGYGLWSARHLPFVADIGDLLARRNVGNYTLSMSHFFDLTGPSFAALRLPAALALLAFAIGPALALLLRLRARHLAATLTVCATAALFLVAAHIALVRFEPMLSSKDFAEKIEELADDRRIDRDNEVMLFGDQAYGSSIPFYLDEQVELVDGRSTSMLFGSTFADAPHIFLSSQQLLNEWGKGQRKILFVPEEKRDEVDRLLGARAIVIEETSGKALLTDRPLGPEPAVPQP